MKCKHCGKEVGRLGPETWHKESGMIRCEWSDGPEDIVPPKAEV